jgi:hypothetical protein
VSGVAHMLVFPLLQAMPLGLMLDEIFQSTVFFLGWYAGMVMAEATTNYCGAEFDI